MILSAITYVLQPPDTAIAFAPRCTEAVSPPSVCASGTTTSSSARPVSMTSPSSESSYSPSETASCATETGMETRPVTDSAAFAYGSRSTSGSPSACWRARIEAGSFLRGRRGIVRSLVELRFEDDPLAQSFVARIPEPAGRGTGRSRLDRLRSPAPRSRRCPRHVALHRACGGEPGGWELRVDRADLWTRRLSELGRLQFEDDGDGVLDVHIPETGLPLDPVACDASFERAREVYSEPSHGQVHLVAARPPARRSTAGVIEHRPLPAPLRAAGRGTGGERRRAPVRLPHVTSRDLDGLHPRTTLERALVERLRAGGTLAGADRGNLAAVTATMMDGKALGAKVREEVAGRGRRARPRRARDRPRRRRSRLAHLHRDEAQGGAARPASTARDHRAAGRHARGGAARARRRAERRRRRSTASSSSCRCPDHIDEDARASQAIAPDQGRRRLPSRSTRASSTSAGRRSCPATPLGIMRAARRVRDPARGRARGRRRPQRDRRQADGACCSSQRERDRDDLPLAHARPRRGTRSTADVLVAAVGPQQA